MASVSQPQCCQTLSSMAVGNNRQTCTSLPTAYKKNSCGDNFSQPSYSSHTVVAESQTAKRLRTVRDGAMLYTLHFSRVQLTWSAANELCEEEGGRVALAPDSNRVINTISDYNLVGSIWLSGDTADECLSFKRECRQVSPARSLSWWLMVQSCQKFTTADVYLASRHADGEIKASYILTKMLPLTFVIGWHAVFLARSDTSIGLLSGHATASIWPPASLNTWQTDAIRFMIYYTLGFYPSWHAVFL